MRSPLSSARRMRSTALSMSAIRKGLRVSLSSRSRNAAACSAVSTPRAASTADTR